MNGTYAKLTGANERLKVVVLNESKLRRYGEATTALNDLDAPLADLGVDDNDLLLLKDGRVVPKVCCNRFLLHACSEIVLGPHQIVNLYQGQLERFDHD